MEIWRKRSCDGVIYLNALNQLIWVECYSLQGNLKTDWPVHMSWKTGRAGTQRDEACHLYVWKFSARLPRSAKEKTKEAPRTVLSYMSVLAWPTRVTNLTAEDKRLLILWRTSWNKTKRRHKEGASSLMREWRHLFRAENDLDRGRKNRDLCYRLLVWTYTNYNEGNRDEMSSPISRASIWSDQSIRYMFSVYQNSAVIRHNCLGHGKG